MAKTAATKVICDACGEPYPCTIQQNRERYQPGVSAMHTARETLDLAIHMTEMEKDWLIRAFMYFSDHRLRDKVKEILPVQLEKAYKRCWGSVN